MQNRKEFLTLRRFCREIQVSQGLFVRTKKGRIRRVNSRTERIWDEEESMYVPKRVPAPVSSRHFIFLGSSKAGIPLMVHVPRSNQERTKSLEGFIEAIQQRDDMPEVVALLRQMRGVKRGKNVFWYCEEQDETMFTYTDYLQSIADEMAVNYA